MSTDRAHDARTTDAPIVTSFPSRGLWLAGTTAVALIVLYFLGIDQGATSIFGTDVHLHEFVHDARHFLGFPCH